MFISIMFLIFLVQKQFWIQGKIEEIQKPYSTSCVLHCTGCVYEQAVCVFLCIHSGSFTRIPTNSYQLKKEKAQLNCHVIN